MLVGCMPMLDAHVHRLISEREVANEIIQEVSLRALAGHGPCDPDCFFAWTCGIARHVVALHWRMQRRRDAPSCRSRAASRRTIRDPVAGPEGRIDARESLGQVIDDIDGRGLELLVRRYILEEPAAVLAHELAQTPAAVRMRLMRLRSSLRARVEAGLDKHSKV